MKFNQFVLATIFLSASSVWACQATPAAEAFTKQLDRNGNGVVSHHEWEHMRKAGFVTDFNRSSPRTFHALDTDNNNKLSASELAGLQGKVRYATDRECPQKAVPAAPPTSAKSTAPDM